MPISPLAPLATPLIDNESWGTLKLPLEHFGKRARTVLHQLNITTVGEFLDVEWNTVVCWQLGNGTREQLHQIHNAMSQNPTRWLLQNRKEAHEPVGIGWPRDVLEAFLPIQSLSVRARNVLRQNDITTLGAFLNFDWKRTFVRQLGAKTRAELLEWRASMGQSPEEVRGWLAHGEACAVPGKYRYLPNETQLHETTEAGLIDWPRLWPLIAREVLGLESRCYQVLKRRFGLDESAVYSLNRLGLSLGISRERVRQIETTAILQLRKALAGQTLRGSKLQLHPRVLEEQKAFKQILEEVGFPIAEEELWELLGQRYTLPPGENEKAYFRLLLELWNYTALSLSPPDVSQKIGRLWLETPNDRTFASAVLRSIAQNLREQVEPVSLFDLQIEVNRALKAEKIERHCDDVALRRLIALWPRTEEIAPDLFQTRFEFLPSNQSRAERILRQWAAQGTLRATIAQLRQEINYRHALTGHRDNVTYPALSAACAASPHITNIGKSGQWTLVENAGETRPVHEIIEEALLKLNRRATLEELTQYVAERRETAPFTVACLMSQHTQFQRVARGVYALRSWGFEDATPVRRGEEYQREFDDLLLEIFLENNVEPIVHAELANKLHARLNWHINTIRMRIERSPWIETTSIDGFHLMAHWCDKPEIAEEKPERLTKTRRVQDAARALLEQSPQGQLAGVTLSTLIEAQTNFVKPLIYSALAIMPDVERLGEPRSMTYRLRK